MEVATRGKKDKHARNARTMCRPGGVASVMSTVAFFIQVEHKLMAAEQLSDVAVSAESPPRADKSNVGEELEQSATSVAPPWRCSPAEFSEKGGPK